MTDVTVHLYHLKNSRSQRIVWLLEELQLDYALTLYHEHIQPNQVNEHPHIFKKFPTLVYQQTGKSPIVLTETTAIVDFLWQLHGQSCIEKCDDPQQLADYYFWKNFADASFIPNLALKQIFSQIVQHTPFPVRFITQILKAGFNRGYLNTALHQQMQHINQQLQQQHWIAGSQFTAADILLWFPLDACTQLHADFQHYKNIQSYLNRLESRPAFQKALNKGQWSAVDFYTYWNKAN